MHSKRKYGLIGVIVTLLFVSVSADVMAVVGRPLTPVSYAGVARRTVRRSGYY